MRSTIITAILLASTATAASIPREEQPQKVIADLAKPTPSSSQLPSNVLQEGLQEKLKDDGRMTMLTTTVTKTATVAMTTATVIRTETTTTTATPTGKPSSKSSPCSSHSGWNWSLIDWLLGPSEGSRTAKDCHEDNDVEDSKITTALNGQGGINPGRLAEGMGCFCSGGSVCCYNSNMQVRCNYGSCGVF